MMGLLSPAGRLTEIQRVVREHFHEGGSLATVLFVLSGIAVVVLLAYGLTIRQRRVERIARSADPRGLFRDLQGKLGLTSPQRQLLDTMAKELRIENPAVILLCPALFDRYLGAWSVKRRKAIIGADESSRPDVAAELRTTLFPSF